ncbi:MAG TPA: ABC transporter permease subunit [Acidimicrobiia bacterium]|nr:ABC transporter permease subunit [Acidimicrobiia bacterium]
MTQATTSLEATAAGPTTSRWWRIGGLVLGWVGFVLIWGLTSRFILDEFVLPGPAKVGAAMWDIVVQGEFIDDFAASISKTFIGFALGALMAVPIGYSMGRRRYWKAFFHDGVVGAGSIPGITYAVLALVIFGTGYLGPVLAVAMISLPYIALSVAEGVEGVDINLINMSQAFKRAPSDIIRQVMVPSIMPFVFAGVRLAFAIAWKVEALTEVFGSSNGVGFQIRYAFQAFSITNVIAWTLLFILFMLLIERGLAKIEAHVFRWRIWEATA